MRACGPTSGRPSRRPVPDTVSAPAISLPTAYVKEVPYTGKPGIAVTEGVCDFSSLHAQDVSPYPGLVAATRDVGVIDGPPLPPQR